MVKDSKRKNWQIIKFEDCLDKVVYTNKIQRKDFLKSGIFPIISQESENINGYWDDEKDLFKCKKPVVIFGDHTQVLKYVDFDFVLGADGVKILQPKEILDSRFFYFLLQSVDLKSLGYARHYRLLKEIDVSFPPLPEQHRIVKILDEVFADVAKAKDNAEKNLQNAKELFESYLQSVFAKPSNEWDEKKLGDKNLFQIIDGDRGRNYPKKSDFLNNGHCLFLNTKNVRPDGFDFRTTMFITEKKDNALGNGKLQRNDVLLTTRGTIGNIAVYDENVPFEKIRINSGMLIFRPNIKFITPAYLFAIFQSGIMKTQIKKYVSGAAQPQLPIKTLVNFSIPVPKSLTEQKSIVAKLDALSAETKKLEAIYQQKLTDLEELKKSILTNAFAGKL